MNLGTWGGGKVGGKWMGAVRRRESSGEFPKVSEKFLEFPERNEPNLLKFNEVNEILKH